MFKFNFNDVKEDQDEFDKKDEIDWYQSVEVVIPLNVEETVKKISRDQIAVVNYDCGSSFSVLSANEVIKMLKEQSDNERFFDALKADCLHSDLLPGKYEGGLKIWECTKDLTEYFMKNEIRKLDNPMLGMRVLDLGCGAGILGIMCLLQGADVTFQDYNQEVLKAMTIPNIFLNCDNLVRRRIKIYSGDWASFIDFIIQTTGDNKSPDENYKFDYILTSETIYNPENYHKLISVFKRLLKVEGLAFVAAKTHYFGVGGDLRQFEKCLHSNGFSSTVCWETSEGISREILRVKLQNGKEMKISHT